MYCMHIVCMYSIKSYCKFVINKCNCSILASPRSHFKGNLGKISCDWILHFAAIYTLLLYVYDDMIAKFNYIYIYIY